MFVQWKREHGRERRDLSKQKIKTNEQAQPEAVEVPTDFICLDPNIVSLDQLMNELYPGSQTDLHPSLDVQKNLGED